MTAALYTHNSAYAKFADRVSESNSVLEETISFNIESPLKPEKALDVASLLVVDDAGSSRGCSQILATVWTNDIKLQSFCAHCSYSEPVRDPAVLQSTYHLVESVLGEYQQALAQADS